jgi:integrase
MRSEVLGFKSGPERHDLPKLIEREARNRLEDILRPINQGRHRPQSTIQFAAFVGEQFEPVALPTLKLSTQQVYRVLLNKHLTPAFGDRRLCDIGRADIQRFILDKLKQGQSWEAANKLRNLLSKVFSTATEWGYLAENPARGVKMPERTQVRPSYSLTAEDVRRLLAVMEEPARTVALVAVLAGLRIGEILGLRWGRLDLSAGTLRVEETCYRGDFATPKTRASRREIPLARVVVSALFAHHSRCADTSLGALVFATRRGTPLSANNLRNRQLRQACKSAGLAPIGWHTLRHTHSSLLHSLGIPLKVAQAQLGHSRLSTTLEIYTHAATEDQRGAVAKLEAQLFPNVPKSGTEQETRNEEVQTIQ